MKFKVGDRIVIFKHPKSNVVEGFGTIKKLPDNIQYSCLRVIKDGTFFEDSIVPTRCLNLEVFESPLYKALQEEDCDR